jgi:tetratricopeptide (TPR) repeat protein
MTHPDATETIEAPLMERASGGAVARKRPDLLAALALAVMIVIALAPQRPSVTTLLDAAASQRAVYRYDRALALYAEARVEAPYDSRPACAEGETLALQREMAAAVAAYQACATLAPDDPGAWLALGDALAATGVASDDARSVAAWRQATQLGSGEAWARLAMRAERLGQLDEATRDWAQALAGGALDAPGQMGDLGEVTAAHLGLLALARGDMAAARGHLAGVERSTSDLATRMRNAGVFLFDQRPPAVALDWEGIGHALLSLDLPTLALGPFQRAVALAPHDGVAHAYYGYTLWMLGQRAAARPQIAAGLTDPPTLSFAYYAAGQVALADGKSALALAYFQTGLRRDARNPALWSAAGAAALATADYLTAQLSYQNAAQYSDTPGATITLIAFYLTHGIGLDDGTAIEAARAGMLRFPGSEPLPYLLGRIYDKLGQSDYAQSAFELAQSLDPPDPGPWLYLGRYAAASGDIIPAAVDLRTALALQPSGPYAANARAALAQLPAATL